MDANVLSWLQPVELVQKIGGGFFQLNDRAPKALTEAAVVWNDVKYPKVSNEVYSDKYRIRKLSCLFEMIPETGAEVLMAIQLTFEKVDDPEVVVTAPVCGVKNQGIPWTHELELEPSEILIGMRVFPDARDVQFKTSHERVISMRSGEPASNWEIWTLPLGFRIYGFHGVFDRHIRFLGPVFKAMDLKQWDQALYSALPAGFKAVFQRMILLKNRHRHDPPTDGLLNFWMMPEVAWDRIVHVLLCECYYDMDLSTFFYGISSFQSWW